MERSWTRSLDLAALDTRRIAIYLGRFRAGLGLAMLVAPGTVARIWPGGDGSTADARSFARLAALREVALGWGTAIAAAQRRGGADWTSMAAIVDAGDAVLSLTARGVPRRVRFIGVLAGATAVAQLRLAREVAAAERDGPGGLGA